MKSATFSKSAPGVTAILVLGLVLGLVATACGDTADVPGEDVAATDPAPATTVPPTTSKAPTPPPTDSRTCAPSCKKDADCQSSCPGLPGGVYCCDVPSGACFGSKTPACPASNPKPTDPPPAY